MRERGEGTWQLFVSAGKDPRTNRYVQKTRTVHGTRRQAERALTTFQAEVDAGRERAAHMTLAELLDEWLAHQEDRVGRRSMENYRGWCRKRINPALGHLALGKVRTGDLDRFYRQLVHEDHLAISSVTQIHNIIHGAFKRAQIWGYLDVSPAELASVPRGDKTEIVPPELLDVRRVIDAMEAVHPDLATFVFLAVATGARRGEICGLRWSDVAVEHGEHVVTIARSVAVSKGETWIKGTKTDRIRKIALDSTTAMVLERFRLADIERARAAGVAMAADPYVFSRDPSGTRYLHPEWVTSTFSRLKQRLGLQTLRLHDLRHLHATRLLALGTDVRTVAGRLGHANAAVTLKVYGHFQPAADRRAAEAIGADVVGALAMPADATKAPPERGQG